MIKFYSKFYLARLVLTGISLLVLEGLASAQVKIGTNASIIAPASILELESTNQGLLLPRLTDTVAINALNPPAGTVIYLTKTPSPGLYIRGTSGWQYLSGFLNNSLIFSHNSINAKRGCSNDTLNINQAGGSVRINGSNIGGMSAYYDDVHSEFRVGSNAEIYSPDRAGDCSFCLVKDNSTNNKIRYTTYGTGYTNFIAWNRARGSFGSPTALQTNDVGGSIVMVGYGTSFVHGAEYRQIATENWSGMSSASGHLWRTVVPGSILQTDAMALGMDATGMGLSLTGNIIPANLNAGTAGADSLLVHDNTTDQIRRISANYYLTSSSAVTTITGTPNQITASGSTGAVTLSLPSTLSTTNINKVAITTPATGATLTLADRSSLITSGPNSITFVSSGATNVTLPTTGTLVAAISASTIIDFADTPALSSSNFEFDVVGAVDGDVVSVGVPLTSVVPHGTFSAWVSALDKVTVRFANNTGGSINPSSGTFKIKVFK